MKKKIILIAVIAIPIILICINVINQIISNSSVQDEITGIPVFVTKPSIGQIKKSLYYSGTLVPESTITIISKIPGKVNKILFKESDMVLKNQILVEIEGDISRLQMEQAHSAWQAALAQYEKTKKGLRDEEKENARALVKQANKDLETADENFERTKRLYESGTIAKANYEEVERAYRSVKTQLDNAERSLKLMEEGASVEELNIAKSNAKAMEAQYKLTKINFQNTFIKSPVNGIIAKILVDEGNQVGLTTPILIIIQDNYITAKIPIPEIHYGKILKNLDKLSALIIPNAYKDMEPFIADITNIASIIDAKSRTFILELSIQNSDKLLRPGMYVNVEIIMEKHDNAILIPKTAVLYKDGQSIVYVAKTDSPMMAITKEIKIGITDDDSVQILSGLTKNDNVIYQGNAFLENEQQIRIVER